MEGLFIRKTIEALQKEAGNSGDKSLKRVLGPFSLIALGVGVIIGAGLFSITGTVASEYAGPAITLSFAIAAIGCCFAGLCYAEFASMIPVSGSAYTYSYATMGELIAWIIGWDLVLEYTVAATTVSISWSRYLVVFLQSIGIQLPHHLTACPWDGGIINLPAIGIVILISLLLVRGTRESSFVNNLIVFLKIAVILVFIILGLGAMFGLVSFDGHHEAIMFKHLTANGLFPNGGLAIVSVMLAVNYAFSGTELIGIAAGETDNPKEAVPRAIKTTIGRLVIFFVLTIVVLASLLPMKEAGVSSAPFVDVFDKMGIPFAADIMNFVILTAILSAGNSGLYASSRMLWSLANEGMLNKKLVKINKHGVPMTALLISMAGAVLSLFSSIYAADTVYLALVSIAGFAVVVVWLSIPLAQINFRKQWNLEHSDDELDYKTPFNPILPYITIVLLAISVLGIAWDSSQRAGLYFGIPFMIFCYLYHYLRFKKW